MDAHELAKKPPMAVPGFKTITPKEVSEYDKKIQAEQEKQMTDCCGYGYSRHHYDQYGYTPRPKNPAQDVPPDSESIPAPESPNVPPPEKKSSKR